MVERMHNVSYNLTKGLIMKLFTLTDQSWTTFKENVNIDAKLVKRIETAKAKHTAMVKAEKTSDDAFKAINETMGAVKGAMLLRCTLNALIKITKKSASVIANYPLTQATYDQLEQAVQTLLAELIKARESGVVIHDTNIELGNVFKDKEPSKKGKVTKIEEAA